MNNLAEFDSALDEIRSQYYEYRGPPEFSEVVSVLVSMYLTKYPCEDIYDSCDFMAWLGLSDTSDDDEERWTLAERQMVLQLRYAYSRYDDEGREVGTDDWMPRVVIGNANQSELVCCRCERPSCISDTHCRECGIGFNQPDIVELLRVSTREPANDVR